MSNDLKKIHSEKGLAVFQDAGAKLLGAPAEQSADKAKNASPIIYVNAASPPVLIIHGGKDDLVPVAQSRRLQFALDRAGVKNEIVIVDNAGHDGPLFSTPEIESQVVNFLTETFTDSGK